MTDEPPVDLNALLVDLSGLDEASVEMEGRRIWEEVYLDRGNPKALPSHDGQDVLFFPDAFDHAFFSSPERSMRPYRKDRVAVERVRRIRWIRELIAGRLSPSAFSTSSGANSVGPIPSIARWP